jgi:N-acetylmuramoyl-L-alanine amidase
MAVLKGLRGAMGSMGSVLTALGRLIAGRRMRLAAGVLALAGVATAAAVSHGETSVGVLKVRLGGDSHQTRIVIELDKPTHGALIADGRAAIGPRQGPQPEPKVVLALAHVDVAGDMQGAGAGLVKSWSVDEAAGAAQVRLILTHSAVVARRFLLPPGDGVAVYRYVIDVSADLPQGGPAVQAPIVIPASMPARALASPVKTAAVKVVHAHLIVPPPPAEPALKVVVIDAGHGGKDPGAAGEDAHEKDITLAAARTLRDQLMATGRYKVVLTRDSDDYIPLESRVRIARQANADLFISLHADSGSDASVRGATVYTLSEQGANRADRQVFEKANWINVDLPGPDEQVNRILLDLTQRQTRNRSSIFAETLLDHLADKTELLRRSHRDAGFMVLLAPDVPAVLMEMGFITNAQDEHELTNAPERRRLMGAVASAIDAYFAKDDKLATE